MMCNCKPKRDQDGDLPCVCITVHDGHLEILETISGIEKAQIRANYLRRYNREILFVGCHACLENLLREHMESPKEVSDGQSQNVGR